MESKESTKDAMTLRAIRDFCPKEMNQGEATELRTLTKRNGRKKVMKDIQPIGWEERKKPPKVERIFEWHESRTHDDKEYDSEGRNETIKPSLFDGRSESETVPTPSQLDWGYQSLSDSDHSCHDLEDEVESCAAVAVAMKRGDRLETIPPANICDKAEWWKVRHLESGQIGFIPRNRFVVEREDQPSQTTLNDLPLELLDVILSRSLLLSISLLKVRPDDRDEGVIRSFASVDFCWFRRTTRRRFKKRIWQRLTRFYGKTKKRYVNMRNNQNYLLENIDPNDKLISLLLSLDCLTEKQCHHIQRQRLRRDKNAEILHVVKSSNETTFSSFVNCLRQTNQKMVARILENGGVVTKATVRECVAKDEALQDPQIQRFIDPHTGSKARSSENEKRMIKLKEDGIEILNSQLDGQTVVVWIWCHSQAAIESIQKLYELNKLSEALTSIIVDNVSTSISEIAQSKIIHMDSNQFEKTFVAFSISINFSQRLDFGNEKRLYGLTKLRNEIYVLCQSPFSSSSPEVIAVFEDRYPFRLQRNIPIRQIEYPWDIGSSEKDNCLYVFDFSEDNTVWKITRDATDEKEKIVKWLTTDHQPLTMSVSSEGHLLMTSWKSTILKIYGSDAALLRSIQLPRDIHEPVHAVETSIGNIIVLHKWKVDEGDFAFSGTEWESKWGICEVTADGQRVIRHFVSSNETQDLNNSRYIRVDLDDRVFVADYWNHRVVLLNSDLKWNQTICSATRKENRIRETNSLFYDDKKRQLIVGGFPSGQGINVYTLNRN